MTFTPDPPSQRPAGQNATPGSRIPDQDAVLASATRLFATRGYHGVSMRDLVEATGLPREQLQERYGSKKAIYRDVRQRHQDLYRAAVGAVLDREQSDTEALLGALDARVTFYREHPELARIALWGWLEGSPLGPPSNESLRLNTEDRLMRAQESGLLREDLDMPSLLALISSGILLWGPIKEHQRERATEDADALYWSTVRRIILEGAGTERLREQL